MFFFPLKKWADKAKESQNVKGNQRYKIAINAFVA